MEGPEILTVTLLRTIFWPGAFMTGGRLHAPSKRVWVVMQEAVSSLPLKQNFRPAALRRGRGGGVLLRRSEGREGMGYAWWADGLLVVRADT